ncbi:MAG: hypothetical protein JJ847_06630 [Prochlorococcus marinus CUG1438]|nr:hypothetical protein [Prochlorococcus marinus CUG1438]
MPTKKKRVGFIPREDVMRIIDKLSKENNLSNSKIISILVEEALSIRGIFNKKNGNVIQPNKLNNNVSDDFSSSSGDFIDSSILSIDTKFSNHINPSNSNHSNEDAFDLQTYKKFLSFLKFQEMMDKYNA